MGYTFMRYGLLLFRNNGKGSFLSKGFSLPKNLSTQVNHLEENYHSSKVSPINDEIIPNFTLIKEFITDLEEAELMKDVEPKLKRQRYQFDHWDDAIHGFKETETVNWREENSAILKRLCNLVFAGAQHLHHVHILDLAEDGYIKPHVDSVRYCGDKIAGISLLSDSVMRLAQTKDPSTFVDILLPRLSLYIMQGPARYDYTHEILHNDKSIFKGNFIKKTRRVSIICRSAPNKDNC